MPIIKGRVVGGPGASERQTYLKLHRACLRGVEGMEEVMGIHAGICKAQKERQVTSRRGGTVGRLAGGDSCPWTPLSFSVCLRGNGSPSDLVCLTVPKCATRSIICGGWFCGEKDLFNFSWLPCTKSVRKENVKYEISNKTKTAL